jgi:hypothetical protein
MTEITLEKRKVKLSKAVNPETGDIRPVATTTYTDPYKTITLTIRFLLETPEDKDKLPEKIQIKWT